METIGYKKNWNLDNVFLGGSKSNQFSNHIKLLEVLVCDLKRCVISFTTPISKNEAANLVKLMEYIGEIRNNLSQANSFITCLHSQNTKDQNAVTLRGKVAQIESHFDKELSKVKIMLVNTKQDIWESLIENKELESYKFILNEWR